jgi:PAS domain S-box-containing protein
MEGRASSFASNVYTAVRKDGSKFRAEVSTSLITYQGKPVMQGVLRDVTENERLEKHMKQLKK